MVDNNVLRFDVHGLVRVVSSDTSSAMGRFLDSTIGRFATDETWPLDSADFILEPVHKGHALVSASESAHAPHGTGVVSFDNQLAFTKLHRNRFDHAVIFGSPLKLFYRQDAHIDRRINDIFLFLIRQALTKQNGLVCHGSVVAHEDRCAIIMGPPMVKKTMLTMALLHDGWDFLSDDIFLMAHGTAYNWQSKIALRGDHYEAFPWLDQSLPELPKFAKRTKLRRAILDYAQRQIPRFAMPMVERFVPNEYLSVSVSKTFPNAKIIQQRKITHGLILAVGPTIKVEQVSRESVAQGMAIVQKMFPKSLRFFHDFASLPEPSLRFDYQTIVAHNLKSASTWRITAPTDAPLDEVFHKVKEALGTPA